MDDPFNRSNVSQGLLALYEAFCPLEVLALDTERADSWYRRYFPQMSPGRRRRTSQLLSWNALCFPHSWRTKLQDRKQLPTSGSLASFLFTDLHKVQHVLRSPRKERTPHRLSLLSFGTVSEFLGMSGCTTPGVWGTLLHLVLWTKKGCCRK